MELIEQLFIYEQNVIPIVRGQPLEVILDGIFANDIALEVSITIPAGSYKILFDDVESFRACDESVCLDRNIIGPGIFIVKNSYFLSDYYKYSLGSRDNTFPTHYRIETLDTLIDVLGWSKPRFQKLR